ncbi:MAG: penicillin acylase family protein, partial [Myxococcota bacterium]
ITIAVLALVGFVVAKSLPSWFLPPELPSRVPLVIQATDTLGPAAPVDVFYDERGMPHIFGESDRDLAYALGFVHARDRAFQMDMLRHAALGRLTELFGKDLLETDQRLRMLTFGLEEQMKRLAVRDVELLEAYCAGVNSGVEHAGRSLEMRILGVEFEPYKPEHVVALARLQSWGLAHDLSSELFRSRVQDAIGADDPRMAAIMGGVPSGGVPIVSQDAHSGLKFASLEEMRGKLGGELTEIDADSDGQAAPEEQEEHGSLVIEPVRDALAQAVKPFFDAIADGGLGASNSWVVSGAYTESGVPMLSNDPHLKHRLPSVFYLTHIEHPDFTAAGITFPGIPAVLIGHTRHFAWGMTTSNIDGQDLVRLDITEDGESYRVDGNDEPFGLIEQEFRFSKGADAESVAETWKTSRFGPVLSQGYSNRHPTFDRFALKWVGYEPELSGAMISGFWDFYRAKDIDEVHEQVAKMSIAGQNMALAFTDGTIAYRLASAIALRASDDSTHLPRDGRSPRGDWVGFLSPDYKPQLTNPEAGYIVAANQRVVDDDWQAMKFAGAFGAMYYRAKRIDERIREQLGKKPFTPEDFLDIQMDHSSIEARVVVPILGKACPAKLEGRSDTLVAEFCREVKGFDGVYSLESTGALPYTLLYKALRHEVIVPILGDELAQYTFDQHAMRAAVEAALLEEAAGRTSPLFSDDGLDAFVARAADRALDELLEMAGSTASSWTWGDHHTLAPAHPLEAAPVIGSLFSVDPKPVSGWRETIHAEHGLPAGHGSALRFVVEMTDPPRSRMVIDAGNSGHAGAEHYDDQRDAWNSAEPYPIELERDALENTSEGRLQLTPLTPR